MDGQYHEPDPLAPAKEDMFPQIARKFLEMDSGERDSQADEELHQQVQNGLQFYAEAARYYKVQGREPTDVIFSALKRPLGACQQIVQDAYANDYTLKPNTEYPGSTSPGSLGTRANLGMTSRRLGTSESPQRKEENKTQEENESYMPSEM